MKSFVKKWQEFTGIKFKKYIFGYYIVISVGQYSYVTNQEEKPNKTEKHNYKYERDNVNNKIDVIYVHI